MDGFIIVTEFGTNVHVVIAADQIRYIFELPQQSAEIRAPPSAQARIALKQQGGDSETVDVTQSLEEVLAFLRKLGLRTSGPR